MSLKRPFESAAQIVDDVMLDRVGPEQLTLHPTLPPPVLLAEQANRKRRKIRPQEPTDLNFVVDPEYVADDFLRHDVKVGTARHLIFATLAMLTLLGRARTWYVDATFKLVRVPFQQLFSVHAFVKSGTSVEQIPLAFVLMSSRRTIDYEAVFRHLLQVCYVLYYIILYILMYYIVYIDVLYCIY